MLVARLLIGETRVPSSRSARQFGTVRSVTLSSDCLRPLMSNCSSDNTMHVKWQFDSRAWARLTRN